jgi:pimeloyl-ACP methyl ester carboxylesterase
MPRALANGIQIHYERQGDSGEPLVLVHGYTGDMTDWQDQAREFSRDYSVITLDLRGHGNSEAPERSNYSIEIMARDVESLVDILGLEKYHLVGHSLGGCIVQEVALSTPKRLLSLTLEDTGPLGAAPADTEMEKFNALQIELAETKGMGAVVELRRQYLDRLPVPVPVPDDGWKRCRWKGSSAQRCRARDGLERLTGRRQLLLRRWLSAAN